MALTADQMLTALHKADPKTLKTRYTPEQLKAAYAKLTAGKAPAPTTPAAGSETVGSTLPDKITTVGQGVDANKAVALDTAKSNIVINNPNVNNPFGTSTTTIDPATGQPTVTQKLSDPQQGILNSDQKISQMGRDFAMNRLNSQPQAPQGFVAGEPAPGTNTGGSSDMTAPPGQPNPSVAAAPPGMSTTGGALNQGFSANTINRVSTGDVAADRARIEKAAYDRLTRFTNADQDRERAQTEQTLYGRGIALDPRNPAYKASMDDLNRRYDANRADAANQAAVTGGNEYSRDVGLNEQVIANQFSQQQGARNQNLGEISTLGNLGTGLQVPNFQAFQGSEMQTPSATDVATQQGTLTVAQKQAQAAIDALKRKGSGGSSSGGSATTVASPFVS